MTTEYQSPDFICHYTTAKSCKGILQSKTLWLTRKKDTDDFIEKMFSSRHSVGCFSRDRRNCGFMDSDIVSSTERICTELYNSLHQSSFCQTNHVADFHRFTIDDYCFMHPRMWEQYGDRYCGLALIFSKEELEQSNRSIHFSAVDYMPLESLISPKPFEGVDIDELKDMGQEQFVTDLKKRIIQESLQKTKDYAEENEFRAIAFSESSETEHMELDISTSIKAIAYFTDYPISDEQKKEQKECLSLARLLGIEIIRISTRDNRVSIQTEEEFKKQSEKLGINLLPKFYFL